MKECRVGVWEFEDCIPYSLFKLEPWPISKSKYLKWIYQQPENKNSNLNYTAAWQKLLTLLTVETVHLFSVNKTHNLIFVMISYDMMTCFCCHIYVFFPIDWKKPFVPFSNYIRIHSCIHQCFNRLKMHCESCPNQQKSNYAGSKFTNVYISLTDWFLFFIVST